MSFVSCNKAPGSVLVETEVSLLYSEYLRQISRGSVGSTYEWWEFLSKIVRSFLGKMSVTEYWKYIFSQVTTKIKWIVLLKHAQRICFIITLARQYLAYSHPLLVGLGKFVFVDGEQHQLNSKKAQLRTEVHDTADNTVRQINQKQWS